MKAHFEKVPYKEDTEWRLLIRELDDIEFDWHFHPEYELTLTLNSCGERYVGDSIEPYSECDLTLLGPNIPHTWQSTNKRDPSQQHTVYVIWFDGQWVNKLIDVFPEYGDLTSLMESARQGIVFPYQLAKQLVPLFSKLKQAPPTTRAGAYFAFFFSNTYPR